MRILPRTPCRILLSHDLNPNDRDKDRTNPLGLRGSRTQDVGIHRILLYRSTIVHDEDRDRRCRLALEEKLDLARQIIPTVGYRLPRPSPCSACQGRLLSSHDVRRARLPALPRPSLRSIKCPLVRETMFGPIEGGDSMAARRCSMPSTG
jgi:hypothetical protein